MRRATQLDPKGATGTNKEKVPNLCGPDDERSFAISPPESAAVPDRIVIGDWTFSPSTASLSRGGEKRRLEHRAAMVLEFLCRRQGEPVTVAELIETVWKGRALSQNSVAVVIGDLRRALDDDARRPRYIETVAKRGYRLHAPIDVSAGAMATVAGRPRSRPRLALSILTLAIFLALTIALWATLRSAAAPPPITIAVGQFPNETGNVANDPLAPAVTELIATHLAAIEGVRVVAGSANPQWRFYGSIVLWNGRAMLAMHAADMRTGTVLWSVMAAGPSHQFPRQVGNAFEYFQRFVRERQTGSAR